MGSCVFVANDNSSFDITVKAQIKGIGSEMTNKFFLHNVLFRCYWASTSPATSSTSASAFYDMSTLSSMSTSTSSYLPTGASFPTGGTSFGTSFPTSSGTSFPSSPWMGGGGQWTPITPSPQTGWLGPVGPSAPLSPRRKMARLSSPSSSLGGGTGMQLSYGSGSSDFSPYVLQGTSRPTISSQTTASSYDQNSLGYGHNTPGYSVDPRYYGGFGGYGSYGNGTS
jgi:hypothetical protein